MSTRIYLLSKKLGMSTKELVSLLQSRGFDVSSASSSIADIYAEDLLREFAVSNSQEPKRESDDMGPAVESAAEPDPSPPAVEEHHLRPVERVDQRPPLLPAQEEAAMPILIRQEAVVRPAEQGPRRMVPLERLQGSNRFVGNRFGQKWNERRDFGGGDRRSGGNFPANGRFGDGRPSSGGTRPGDRPAFSGKFGRGTGEQRRGDFRAPPRASERPASSFSLPPSRPLPAAAPRPPSDPRAIDALRQEGKALRLKFPICVREFASEVGLKPFQLISELMQMGIFASMNYLVDETLAKRIGEKFSLVIEARQECAPTAGPSAKAPRKPAARGVLLEPRPPVVCVLGHVDHGKTTLLDHIRRANVAASEAGGITQHIGAYEVDTPGGRITFIDTPGHAAFSKMRERGANLTDLAVLVVAADDGFMPQTDEALKFARNAAVPVVVAINKVDAKGANINRVRQQMQQRGIAPEDWGGETLCGEISALNGDGIPKLLELILVQAEMLSLRADRRAPVEGTVLESQIEVGRGPTASAIVQNGTLTIGDALVCGTQYCKVRALLDGCGKPIKEAPPSKPVKIIGWSGVLESGTVFTFAESEKAARELAEEARVEEIRGEQAETRTPSTRCRSDGDGATGDVEALFAAIHAKNKRALRVIVKGDVQGSVEALVACLAALPQNKIRLEILRAAVGPLSLSDVEFARPVGATLVAFNVRSENGVQAALKQHGITLLQHDVIYMLIDRVREAMADLLDPELVEEKLGAAQVRQLFQLSKGTIAGCMVTEGKVLRDGQARIWREGKQTFDGRIGSLRREKED
ncbi:MAG: translation initiation factor IF-2, partial [Puniceicoccales bacterium]|nr:translation initiation factor IF-2 [Puniceicoccales bacterium]